jgi:ABC-2 type transport system ATP-binding protein
VPAVKAVEVEDLVVAYGQRVAVDGVSFEAAAGEVLGLLGPNGAGKTTTVETLEGYLRPSRGRALVLGRDPVADHSWLAGRVGVMLQGGGVYRAMSPARALRLFAAYYDRPRPPDELLELLGLAQVADTPWRALSGGEQQRLSLALALVGRPQVVFLDEPTSGVDPAGRVVVRQVVRQLSRDGACVVVTTHEMDEAERLADRLVVVDSGRVVASGTPAELTAQGPAGPIRFGAPAGLPVGELASALGAPVREEVPGEYVVDKPATPAAVAELTAWLARRDLPLADLRAGRQRLEDVFLSLTGPGATSPGPAPRPVRPGRRRRPAASQPPLRLGALVAQARAEVAMTLARGDSLLLALGIPVLLLVFFSLVKVLPLPAGFRQPVDFLAPGVLALAVMSTGMVSLGISTGFERGYGVLKRLGSTPLGRPALVAAKMASVLVVEALQVVVIVAVAAGLGWRPQPAAGQALAAVLLATLAFSGLGLALAGSLPAEVTLAAANGLWLVLLLLGGMVVPLSRLPGGLQALARALPAAGLSEALGRSLGTGSSPPAWAWAALAAWAVASPLAAAATFDWG